MCSKNNFSVVTGIILYLAISTVLSGCLKAIDYDGPDTGAGDTDADADGDSDGDTDSNFDADSSDGSDAGADDDSDSAIDSDSESETEFDGCPGNFNPVFNCETCIPPFEGDNCDICPDNWDAAGGCISCLGNWSLDDDCTVCAANWVDNNDECGTCPGNWDAEQDCNECRNHWYGEDCETCPRGWDSEKDCGECAGNWDGDECRVCLGNWDRQEDCQVCLNHWIDEDNNCGTCPLNWDPDADCNACRGNWDIETECTTCLNSWIDEDNDCGTCPASATGVDCDTCNEGWTGETCQVAYSDDVHGSVMLWPSLDQPLFVQDGGSAVWFRPCASLDCDVVGSSYLASGGDIESLDAVTAPDGSPLVIYKDALTKAVTLVKCDDDVCESYSSQTIFEEGDDGSAPFILIGEMGLPVLARVEYATLNVEIFFCDDLLCTTFKKSVIETNEPLIPDSLWVPWMGKPILDARSRLLFFYTAANDTDDPDRILRCNDADCSDVTTSPVEDVYMPSIIIDDDSFPLMAVTKTFGGASGGELKLIDCDDVACANHTVTRVHSGDVYDAQIMRGSNGYPLIAYKERINDKSHVYLMGCEDDLCAEKVITTLERISLNSDPIFFGVGPDGNPILSYEDGHYYHCATPNCR